MLRVSPKNRAPFGWKKVYTVRYDTQNELNKQ